MSGRGFTLVEALAAVALLALAVGTIAAGVGPAARGAGLGSARSAVLEVDARARVLAQAGRPVAIVLEGGGVCAYEDAGGRGAPVVRRELPGGVAVSLREVSGARPLRALLIGTDGRSADYEVVAVTGGRVSETLVAGVTGYGFAARISRRGTAR